MIKEFLHALGIEKLLKYSFQTNDPALSCIHKEDENLLQMLYQIFGTYHEDRALTKATRFNMADYAITYGEFFYQASSWRAPRRVVFKIEKPYGQMVHMYTFIVTNMEELGHWQVIDYYCNRSQNKKQEP